MEMQALIEEACEAAAVTLVLVTHDFEEAVVLADRVLVMEAGRLVLDLEINLARPRARGCREFVALKEEILAAVLDRRVARSAGFSPYGRTSPPLYGLKSALRLRSVVPPGRSDRALS
jgi:ABC-type proline/glycine betaine transport system ATPase subunit